MSRIRLHHLLGAAWLAAAAASAQPLQLRVQLAGTVQNVADGGTISFSADAVGRPVEAILTATYRGSGSLNINRFEFTGSTDFTVTGVPAPEIALLPNETFTASIRFRPATSARVSATLRFFYTDTPPSPPGGRATTGTLGVNMNGVAPEFVFTVIPPPAGNAVPILPGETIAFPATPVDETATATLVVTNRGTGPGSVALIRSSGDMFSLAGLPVFPAAVDAGRDLRLTIRYAPTAAEPSTGGVTLEFVDRTVSFRLTGSATAPGFSYEVIQDTGSRPLAPGGLVTLPDVALNERSTASIRVRNTGNADGRITGIAVQGTGFTLTDAPFLPLVLTPGGAATITVTFSPATAGPLTGRLRIGNDTFELAGNGLGVNLSYSFIAGSVSTTVASGGSVIFPPAAVGQSSTVRFAITNLGTLPGAVTSVGVVPVSAVFTSSDIPALPATLEPGQTFSFVLTFAPTLTGNLTGSLRVDSLTFTLSGVASPPPALPDYRFTGASGVQQPGQQVSVGLSLSQAYSLSLTGTLTLAFNSDVFANDPAVQFAIGGRTIGFTIPAGQRDAVFAHGQSQIALQTGTVAGTITLTPSFQSDAGLALTPANPPALTLTVAPGAPRLLTVQISSRAASTLTLLITGYSTSRQITQVDLTFTPVTGENVTTSRLTLAAEPTFNAWYQSSASVPYGSQFTATVTLSFQGEVVNAANLAETIRSVSATLTNRLGASNAVSVDIK